MLTWVGVPGAVGGLPSGGVGTETVSESRFAAPSAVVEGALTGLGPAVRGAVMVAVAQVVHTLVLGKFTVTAVPPLTLTVIGRLAVVPLEYRKDSVAVPALAALTVHVMELPTALVSLQ